MAFSGLDVNTDLGQGFRDNRDLQQYVLTDVTPTGRKLGIGSFGSVEEVTYQGTICAGKRIHESLLDVENEGVPEMVSKYLQECQLMSSLRHPNITQFLGICFLPGTQLPLLVMERLEITLDDLLENVPNLLLSLKCSILENVASGLLYLHERNPPVMHRNLTARDILLTSTCVAKITDFGNSSIVDMRSGQKLSPVPGTFVYMPPEAMDHTPHYGPSLDIFSFGHLALFTITQKFPGDLLPATFYDAGYVQARSEVQRREQYIKILEALVGHNHPALVELVKVCLSNVSVQRPTADDLVVRLRRMKEKMNEQFNGGDIIKQLQIKRLKQRKRVVEEQIQGLKGDHTREKEEVDKGVQGLEDVKRQLESELTRLHKVQVDAEKLLYEAMEKGFVTSQDLILVLVGIAGSGKSSFKRVVLDLPLEELRVSTPLAEAGIRNISISRATISNLKGIKWEMVTSKELLEMLADAIKEVGVPKEMSYTPAAFTSADKPPLQSAVSQSLSTTPTVTGVTENEMKSRDQKASHQERIDSAKMQSDDTPVTAHEHDDNLEFKDDPLLLLISKSKGSRRLLRVHWVYIIDTGGQPQFLQLLPAFIKNISACVCILRLDQNLDDHPLVQYFDTSGKQVGEPYPSEQTNLQVVESCVRTIHSKCSLGSNKSPGCFVVGTHLDQYEEGKCAESIEEKNERLLQKLSNTDVEASMMFYGTGDENEKLIFPLNCKNPEERDHNVAAEFRKCVMNRCPAPEVKIPLAWFVLEERIRQYATKKGVPYVERATCAKIANTLHMSKEIFEAALNHLLKLNIFRCYSSAPDLIFCTTQVILQKLTELVQYSFQLRTTGVHGITGEDINFKNEGIISIEFLQRFPSYYFDIFTPECFLKILRELLAVADMQGGKYFLPSLLNELSDKELSKHRSSSSSLSALLILLHSGCLLNGIFTSLVASLKNNCGWQLAVGGNRRKPACLHQNCVTFKVPGKLPGSVTLIASFNYLEVHVTCSIEPKIDGICTRVYRDIKSGLETSWRVLYPGEVSYTPAFFCSSCPDSIASSEADCTPSTTHHADVSEEGDYEICSANSNYGSALHESKLRWLKNIRSNYGATAPASYQQKRSLPLNDEVVEAGSSIKKQLLSASSSHHYISQLPIAAIQYLDKKIDWDNDYDRDLVEIAKHLLQWEELLATLFKLSRSDIDSIRGKNQQSTELQRRDVLRTWQSNFHLDATYKCLLEILAKANHTEGTKAVCRVLKRRAANESPDAS